MARAKDKGKDHERALRAFAESSRMSSDSEDGLDIVRSTRRTLDLSQYIDGLHPLYFVPPVS